MNPGVNAVTWFTQKLIGPLFVSFIHASPEIFAIAAMGCFLIAMTGSGKFFSRAGTCLILAFVGQVLSIGFSIPAN